MHAGPDAADARYVIAVAAPVGGGKSTLVKALASRLEGAAAIHFDHYERITEQPIEEIRRWMQDGADVDEMVIPRLADDLQALKLGGSVVDPQTGKAITARKYVLFETQFGRQHAATGRHIDFLVWVDTPLDVALARKIRQFAGELDVRNQEEFCAFAPWLRTYLDNYIAVVGALLRIQRDTVGEHADLVVDGELDADALLAQVTEEILNRFG
jgi:uridine kinase